MLICNPSVKWGALCGVLTVFFMGPVQAEGSRLHVCPGNLYTNQLSAQQARQLGCQPAAPARVSQAQPMHQWVAVAGSAVGPAGVAAPATGVDAAAGNPAPAGNAAAKSAETTASNPSPAPVASRNPSSQAAAPSKNVDSATRRARDRDARLIIESELNRTVERLEQMTRQATTQPGHEAAVRRLREDEAALLRELARLPS